MGFFRETWFDLMADLYENAIPYLITLIILISMSVIALFTDNELLIGIPLWLLLVVWVAVYLMDKYFMWKNRKEKERINFLKNNN